MKLKATFPIIIAIGMIFFFYSGVTGQVVINEVSTSNNSIIANADGEFDDWIELYNAGNTAADLNGYGLTDDLSNPFRFRFPSYILTPGERMLLFASDTVIQAVNHYEMPVEGTGVWKYILGSSSLDTNWRNLSFNDSGWDSGPGGIGFSDDDDGTEIDPNISVMMRQSFFINDTSQVLKAIFMMDYDDGFVAYLNGVEIARANMSSTSGRPAWDELAPEPHEAQMFAGNPADSFYISPAFLKSILRPGLNVLAVETHDRVTTPTDMSSIPFLFFGMKSANFYFPTPPSWFQPAKEYFSAGFKLSRNGVFVYLINPSGGIYDQVTVPALEIDNSYARIPDGFINWCHVEVPTPLQSNNSSPCRSGYASAPIFSKNAGYYSTPLTLGITTNQPGGVIRYTINGDVPDSGSTLYTGNILIDSTVTLRARVFAPGLIPGQVVTNTYFINEDVHLPVFCITTDSLNLWDENTGIYTWGPNADTIFPYYGANFWQPWSKPASIEYYDKNKNRVINFNAEIEIYGNYSRYRPQKSFEIKLSDKFGQDEVNYTFLPDKPYLNKFDRLLLRNSGTDWNYVHFRDALMQRIMKDTYSGYVAAEPVVGFLNGKFWGVYMLNEKYNKKWVEMNYGCKKGEYDYMEEIGNDLENIEGSDHEFMELYNYSISQNPATQQFYDDLNGMLDLRNFADYFIANTYCNNGDWLGEWTNNIRIWRAHNLNDTRLKYMLIDMDFGFGLRGNLYDNRLEEAINPEAFSHSSEIFDASLHNPTFKNYFINRYADLINTIYLPSNVENVMKQFRDSMKYDMVRHFATWGSDTASWNARISNMINWVNLRPAIMRDYIRDQFNLDGEVTLTLNTYPPGSGRIEISTITPDTYPWSGIYFNGNPVNITAIANPGFTFDHWDSDGTIPANDTNIRITHNFTSSEQITAYFTGTIKTPQLTVSEINYNSSPEFEAGDWIELYNYGNFSLDISGWRISDEEDQHKFIFPSGTIIPAGGYLVVCEDTSGFKKLFPGVSNRTGQIDFNFSNSGEQIRLFDYQGTLYLSLFYSDLLPWPPKADGLGYTCELIDRTVSLDNGANWFAGCYGGSPGRAYSTELTALNFIDGDNQFCIGENTLLSLTDLSLASYQWSFNDQEIQGAIQNNYLALEPGTYRVAVEVDGCSTITNPAIVEELPYADMPTVTDGVRCNAGPVMLIASSPYPVTWYENLTGNSIATGDTLISSAIESTTVFYARAEGHCPSERTSVFARIETDACNDSLIVYPNPSFTKNLIIQSHYLEPGLATLVLSDMSGKTIINRSIRIYETGRTNELQLEYLDAGIYILTVLQEERRLITRYVRL